MTLTCQRSQRCCFKRLEDYWERLRSKWIVEIAGIRELFLEFWLWRKIKVDFHSTFIDSGPKGVCFCFLSYEDAKRACLNTEHIIWENMGGLEMQKKVGISNGSWRQTKGWHSESVWDRGMLTSVTKGKGQRKSSEVRRCVGPLGVSISFMTCEEGHPWRVRRKRRRDYRVHGRLEESRQVK